MEIDALISLSEQALARVDGKPALLQEIAETKQLISSLQEQLQAAKRRASELGMQYYKLCINPPALAMPPDLFEAFVITKQELLDNIAYLSQQPDKKAVASWLSKARADLKLYEKTLKKWK